MTTCPDFFHFLTLYSWLCSYTDSRFDPSIDKRTGFRTNQMLCVPVTNYSGKAIGAIQIINTHHGMAFGKQVKRIARDSGALH